MQFDYLHCLIEFIHGFRNLDFNEYMTDKGKKRQKGNKGYNIAKCCYAEDSLNSEIQKYSLVIELTKIQKRVREL